MSKVQCMLWSKNCTTEGTGEKREGVQILKHPEPLTSELISALLGLIWNRWLGHTTLHYFFDYWISTQMFLVQDHRNPTTIWLSIVTLGVSRLQLHCPPPPLPHSLQLPEKPKTAHSPTKKTGNRDRWISVNFGFLAFCHIDNMSYNVVLALINIHSFRHMILSQWFINPNLFHCHYVDTKRK